MVSCAMLVEQPTSSPHVLMIPRGNVGDGGFFFYHWMIINLMVDQDGG